MNRGNGSEAFNNEQDELEREREKLARERKARETEEAKRRMQWQYVTEEERAYLERESREAEVEKWAAIGDVEKEQDLEEKRRELQWLHEAEQREEAKRLREYGRETAELRLEKTREEREREAAIAPYREKVDIAAEKYHQRRLGEAKAQRVARVGRGVSSVSGALFKVATLGGPPKGAGKAMRELYVPTGMRKLTAPEGYRGMRQLTTLGGPKEIAAGRAMMPQYGGMRQLTTPSGLSTTRIGAMARETLPGGTLPARQTTRLTASPMVSETAMARLRSLAIPRNLSQSEQLAYAEIKSNRDADTRKHVISELAKLGVSGTEAGKAVDSLLRKGVVRKDRMLEGEPILEVVR